MTGTVSRRAFIAGLAAASAACARIQDAFRSKDANKLTVNFTGLIVFFHDKDKAEMLVGLQGHGHETVVVARKADVPSAEWGSDLSDTQWAGWNPVGLGANKDDLTYWKGTKFSFNLTDQGALSVKAPFGVFPLTDLAKKAPELTEANCQSLLRFKKGEFSGKARPHISCGHEMAEWAMVKDELDAAPVLEKVKLIDRVQFTTDFTAASFTIDRRPITLKTQKVDLWVLQIDSAGPEGKEPREILHCQHYYDVIPGYRGDRYYPYRGPVPGNCKVQLDVDPIYCTPGE